MLKKGRSLVFVLHQGYKEGKVDRQVSPFDGSPTEVKKVRIEYRRRKGKESLMSKKISGIKQKVTPPPRGVTRPLMKLFVDVARAFYPPNSPGSSFFKRTFPLLKISSSSSACLFFFQTDVSVEVSGDFPFASTGKVRLLSTWGETTFE